MVAEIEVLQVCQRGTVSLDAGQIITADIDSYQA